MTHWCSSVCCSSVWFVIVFISPVLAPIEALQHNYYTRRDKRNLIGPLGFPFGFLEKGSYNLTVFDFQLSPNEESRNHYPYSRSRSLVASDETNCNAVSGLCLSNVLSRINGVGFLLKQFEDESTFNHYMASIQEHPGRCIFQQYLDLKKDDELIDDDDDDNYIYEINDFSSGDGESYDNESDEALQGLGEVIDAVEDGIYLDMMPRSHWKPHKVNVAYDFETGQAGFYFLMYQVCYNTDEKNPQNLEEVTNYHIYSQFELDFHFSNRDMFGHISYLSRGEMNLPWLFFSFSFMYAIFIYVWHVNIKLIREGKPGYFDIGYAQTVTPPTVPGAAASYDDGQTIYPIHYLMGYLLMLKFCSLLFESIRYHYLRVTGRAIFFSVIYYTFAFLKGVTLFTVILLIGSGWSFVKPFLIQSEKKLILGVLILQVINNIAIVILTQETEGEISFDRWTAILHLVDILCCCAILVPIVWQLNELENRMEQNQQIRMEENKDKNSGSEDDLFINTNDGPFDDNDGLLSENELDAASNHDKQGSGMMIPDARMALKLKLFRSFYMLVIAYIYMTRIVVYLFATTLNYKHTWIPIFVVELTTIHFYFAVGYMFRPMIENPYLHVGSLEHQAGVQQEVEMHLIDPSTKAALD